MTPMIVGVDRAASLRGPVDVAEIEPEGELVERQSRTDPEGNGEQVEPRVVGWS